MKKTRNNLIYLTFFIVCLLFFSLRNHYYDSATLIIKGHAKGPAKLVVQFDTGNGFTVYESIESELNANNQEPDFSAEISLPHSRIIGLKTIVNGSSVTLSSFQAQTVSETRELLPTNYNLVEGLTVKPFPVETSRFHLGLFILQLGLSLFCTYLFALCCSIPWRVNSFDWRGTLKLIFLVDHRWVFWAMFFVSCFCFLFWFLAYYPAAMTNDSWSSLNEVHSLKLKDWHPYIYTIYMLALMQFLNSIAGIPLFQILVTAGLVNFIFYYSWRRGAPFLLILPFFIIFILLPPTGLYNVIVWKDVPFALSVLLLSFIVYLVRLHRARFRENFQFPLWSLPLLALAIILLCQVRHNGLMFYFLLPLFFMGCLHKKQYSGLCFFLVFSFVFFQKIIPASFDIQKAKGSPYHQFRTVLAIMAHPAYYSKDRARDIKIVEEASGLKWEDIMKIGFPVHWFKIWDATVICKNQFELSAGETADYNKKFLTRLVLENLPIFLAARTFDFFHSIGIDQSGSDATNNFFENPLQLWGSNLHPPGKFLFGVSLASEPIIKLYNLAERYFVYSLTYHGLFSPQVIIWNLLFPFGIMFVLLVYEKGLSPINFFAYPGLLAALGVFAAGAGESWRYFYYIYLYGLVIIPLYASYRCQSK